MAVWPASLPAAFLTGTTRREDVDNRIRSEVDRGPAKLRRATTLVATPFSGDMILTEAQLDTLDAFYDDTLAGGVLAFDFVGPFGWGLIQARFLAPVTPQRFSHAAYRVTIQLERLP